MIETIDFDINGEKYQLLPHTGFEALNLDRKVTALFSKVFNTGAKTDGEFYSAITESLASYSDDEYRWLVGTTLSRVTVTTPGKKAVRLSDMDAVADHFRGRGSELCAAMLTVWRKEKLSPFERAQEVEEGATAGP